MTELTSKNLYDYLSKNNAKQRKIERMLEVFDADQVKIEELLMAGARKTLPRSTPRNSLTLFTRV